MSYTTMNREEHEILLRSCFSEIHRYNFDQAAAITYAFEYDEGMDSPSFDAQQQIEKLCKSRYCPTCGGRFASQYVNSDWTDKRWEYRENVPRGIQCIYDYDEVDLRSLIRKKGRWYSDVHSNQVHCDGQETLLYDGFKTIMSVLGMSDTSVQFAGKTISGMVGLTDGNIYSQE